MSKIKRKTTGFDIAHRIGVCLMALAAFPLLYFLDFVYYLLNHTSLYTLFNLGSALLNGDKSAFQNGQTGEFTEGYINFSKLAELKDIFQQLGGDSIKISNIIKNEAARPLIISLAVFALALVMLILVFFVAAFTNKKMLTAILGGVGALACAVSNILFNTLFAKPLIDGVEGKQLADILGLQNSIGGIIVQFLSDVEDIRYADAFYAVFFICIGICIWSLSFIIVNSGDKEEKKYKIAKKQERLEKKERRKAAKVAKKAREAEKKTAVKS
ncbi:MAG: hypothetical protein K5761_01115 [Clostridiales bacterium]|nr:hypothetical protein [Clostridiales bacterium]